MLFFVMRTFRGFFVFLAALLAAGALPVAAQAGTVPVSVSLEGQPYSASWPDSASFTARLKVEAGSQGADFGFQLDPTGWGLEGVGFGSVFRDGQAVLDGPGELTSNPIGSGGPSGLPGYCSRGGQVPNFDYRLKLLPDTSTVVEIPVSLNASPLEGMNSNLRIKYYASSPTGISPTIDAPVQVGGKTGVLVRFDTGSSGQSPLTANNREPIRLSGSTAPSLPNTEILIKATPFAASPPAPPVRSISVTTDAEGNFSREVVFDRSAFWRLTAHPMVDSSHDDEPSCGPTLVTTVDTYGDLPAEAGLSASAPVSWPDQKDFEYRLSLTAGDHGADFNFEFQYSDWGLSGVSGTPFSIGEAALEGPGSLTTVSTSVADPVPTACWRGGFGSVFNTYNLKLDPNQETVVTVPATLLAPRLAGMKPEIGAVLSAGDGEPQELTAPVTITGEAGIRIIAKVAGATGSVAALAPGLPFRLVGRTVPTVKNRLIRLRVEPRIWEFGRLSPAPVAHRIAVVRTDGNGRFRSQPVTLGREAQWVLTSRLLNAGEFDNRPNCNGTLDSAGSAPTTGELIGRSYRSVAVRGTKLKKPLKISFATGPTMRRDENGKQIEGPLLLAYVDCNGMGGEYKVRDGRLTWFSVYSTAMYCPGSKDGWLLGLLGRGARARTNGSLLTLSRGNQRLVLRETGQ